MWCLARTLERQLQPALERFQAWGVAGGDRYLLDLKKGHMSYVQCRRAVLEQATDACKLRQIEPQKWPLFGDETAEIS